MNFMNKTVLAIMVTAAVSTAAYAQAPASPARLDEVAERGRHVMPFHLDKTQHIFNKTAHGGIQQVVAKQATDTEQIGLIRQHLSYISERFKQGDFSRQKSIHGDSMPGLQELSANYRSVSFDYRPLPNGAEIEYAAEDTALVDAIHRFFNAQLSDHARHASDGQPMKCEHDAHHQHGKHKKHHPMNMPAASKE